jgi:formylmethanofuran dehydrogenase subunit E
MKLKVTHDVQPENEIFINATEHCDICGNNYPEDLMRYLADVAVCEGCYDHYN